MYTSCCRIEVATRIEAKEEARRARQLKRPGFRYLTQCGCNSSPVEASWTSDLSPLLPNVSQVLSAMGRNHPVASCNHSSSSSSSGNNNPGAPSPAGRGRVLIFRVPVCDSVVRSSFLLSRSTVEKKPLTILGEQKPAGWISHFFFISSWTRPHLISPHPFPRHPLRRAATTPPSPRYQAQQRPLAVPLAPLHPPVTRLRVRVAPAWTRRSQLYGQ